MHQSDTVHAATRDAVARLFAAIEARDLPAIEAALHVDATWQNVPHPPSVGRDAVVGLLAPILGWSDAVHWDVVSASYEAGSAWIERVDRFVIDGMADSCEFETLQETVERLLKSPAKEPGDEETKSPKQ